MPLTPSTFSIVAADPFEGEIGVAVQSKFLAVGSVVPWARAGVGAIATQSWANTAYGPRGLDLLKQGMSPQEVVDTLTRDDPDGETRQVGIVDAAGDVATFTGSECFEWSGGKTGYNFACQGNILVSGEVLDALGDAFEASIGEELADRLVKALEAAQEAGGDRRGQQSAALLVVKEAGGYGGFNDRYIDLRVDDHPEPIAELRRLLGLHKLYYPREDELVVPLEGEPLERLVADLRKMGYLEDSEETPDLESVQAGLRRFSLTENLEERLRDDDQAYQVLLDFVHSKAEG